MTVKQWHARPPDIAHFVSQQGRWRSSGHTAGHGSQGNNRPISPTASHTILFFKPDPEFRNGSSIRQISHSVADKAGAKAIHLEAISETRVMITIANGANVKAVAARVGHRDITTTLKTYTALTAAMDDDLMDIVEAVVPRRNKNTG